MDSAADIPDSVALLRHHSPRDLPEGRRSRYPVAAGPGPFHLGRGHSHARRAAIEQTARVRRAQGSRLRAQGQYVVLIALLAAGTVNASPQAVTATSGDPAVLAAIQRSITATDLDTTRFRRTEHALLEYSAEGGKLVALYDGTSLRKLSAYLTGE